jgi:calcineurin-like phosphoesterase
VATADACILPRGTAYITDVGMTGAHDSVLGRNKSSVIKAFRTQMPVPFEIATDDVRINALYVTVDSHTKRAEHVQRIEIIGETAEPQQYDSDDGKPEYYNNHF